MSISGSAEIKGQLTGFLEAVYSLDKVAVEMETSLVASCKELGTALEMPEDQLTAELGGGEGAKTVCGNVAAKITEMLNASASVSLSIELGEPTCSVSIDAMTECLAGCGAAIDPGKLEASCEGGEIAGTCSGKCEGSCTVEAGAECNGECGGVCEGKCDGNESKGSCEGTCEGKCSASCKMKGEASCSGSCSGGCDVKMEAPKCTGEFKPPNVDASCHMNCTAKTAASATCDPPSVKIKIEGEASSDIEKLVAALQVSLPKIVNIQLGMAKKLAGTIEGLVQAGKDLPSIAASAGLEAIGCIAGGAAMAISASASISVNVEASASVGGAASAG